MSYTLFVGGVEEYLGLIAHDFDYNSQLLLAGQKPESGKTYYTSVADMETLENFSKVCLNAKCIFYAPPDYWNTKIEPEEHSEQYWAEYFLTFASQTIPVHNLPNRRKKYTLDPNTIDEYTHLSQYDRNRLSLQSVDDRKTDGIQIWAVGDSVTSGVGVTQEDTWKVKISKKMGLPFSDLSTHGSSIQWAANQILQSDIRKDDYVFWGLTLHYRHTVVDPYEQTVKHIVANSFQRKEIKNTYPIEYVDSDTTVMHNINAIRNVYNFCKKIGAKLVIIGVSIDWDSMWVNYDVPYYYHPVYWPQGYIDLGEDGKHPGPKQHDIFVEEFVKLSQQWYGQ